MKGILIFFGLVFGALYLYYRHAKFSGPTGPVNYRTNCSFLDWLTRRCETPYTPKGGIFVS